MACRLSHQYPTKRVWAARIRAAHTPHKLLAYPENTLPRQATEVLAEQRAEHGGKTDGDAVHRRGVLQRETAA